MTSEELEQMRADFVAKGGNVKVLPPTEYEAITSDDARVKNWGLMDSKTRLYNKSYQEQLDYESGDVRDGE